MNRRHLLAALAAGLASSCSRPEPASTASTEKAAPAATKATPEVAAAPVEAPPPAVITPAYVRDVSNKARGALKSHDLETAERLADQTREMSLELLKQRPLDAEPDLPIAFGASMEVQAQVMAQRGEVSSAVGFLETERRKYKGTSIIERIQKNINLLTLEGKPAPSLSAKEWIGKPGSVVVRGKPTLVFFWAHWCSDCKNQAPILDDLMRRYSPLGLTMIAPTRYYGYVAGGEDAPPKVEKQYIEAVRDRYYPLLANVPTPLSNAIFETYGCSSTPTLALIDKTGVVRWYHPGNATMTELIRQVTPLL